MNEIYKYAPQTKRNGIPIFATADAYTDNYGLIAEDHLEVMNAGGGNPFIEDLSWRSMEAATGALIERFAAPGARILDVGVGTGRLLERFPGLNRYGLDISLDYLRLAREKGIEACFARAEDMPYPRQSFDIAVCTDVLEHVLDVNATISEIQRVLKPGGLLIIRVPYCEDLSPYLQSDYPYKFAHLRTFDENSLQLTLCRIFDFEFVLADYVTLIHGGKFRFPLPGIRWLVAGRLAWFVRQFPSLHAPLARLLCTPTFINIVVRKAAPKTAKTARARILEGAEVFAE